jgi:hypothetical protein
MAWLQTQTPQIGTEPEPVDAQNRIMKDVFARCLKKNIAQKKSMYTAQIVCTL